ncbi:MAG: zinc/manganese transport system permease protein [Chloroflexota bacterium]|nr:zinc/manganese transport system permease protein [Chloroflexota bacterium]
MPDQSPSWDPLADFQLLVQFHFMQNAVVVGTVVAVLAGAVGYFIVLRGQSFAAHMLSQVGFPGAAAAVLLHVSPVAGMVGFCLSSALGLNALGRRAAPGSRVQAAATGSILAFSIGLGLLFFRLSAGSAQAIYAFLFGTILGITDGDVSLAVATAALCLVGLAIICRPLLFASVDPDVAEAQGVPVRMLSTAFLVLVAIAVAESVQVVGTLLIFALLVAPAASARHLTARPYRGLALSVVLSLLFTWAGLSVAYFSSYPVGFFITTFAFGAYLIARISGARRPPWQVA